jgi:hypothetical protein
MPKRRHDKETVTRVIREQAEAIRNQETPTPSGEPHRIVSTDSPVVKILNEIAALDDDGIDFLFQMLDSGMWDEWDCSLIGGIEMGMGSAEIRIAAKSGASAAQWIVDHPNAT